ncbi:unnamed protein product [Pylaiella littoralis]
MACLRAWLLGDIATLYFPARKEYYREGDSNVDDDFDDDDGQGELRERKEGLGYILDRGFGKVGKVASTEKEVALRSSSSSSQRQPTTATDSGLRCLQLSLEEAFYLAHVDECLALALAIPRVAVPTAAAAALRPSPTRRERHVDDVHPHPLYCHQQGHEDEYDDAGDGSTTGEEWGAGCGFISGGSSGSGGDSGGVSGYTDADNVGSRGAAWPLLSSDEAWRYCCHRRSDFPAMFAVYRHFRARGYVVHTGHKYGAHFVLYEGSPDECHSRYCVHVTGGGGGGDSWGHMKTVTRLMPDVAKCLLVCGVTYHAPSAKRESPSEQEEPGLSSPPPPPTDTSSLAALAVAEVTALRFSRSRESDDGGGGGGGGKGATTVLKVRRPATMTQSVPRNGGSRRRNPTRELKKKSEGMTPDR